MNRIALALTIAAISTGASAQCSQDGRYCGPAKVINIPSATAPVAPQETQIPELSTVQQYYPNPSLIDGCVFEAVGRLPKVEGARVASTKAEFFRSSPGASDYWNIFVTIDFNGKPLRYRSTCRVWRSGAELTNW